MKHLLVLLTLLAVGCSSNPDKMPTKPLSIEIVTVDPVSACIRNANGWERYAMRTERARYREAIAACQGDSTCLAWIWNEHESLVAEIRLDAESWRYFCLHGPGVLEPCPSPAVIVPPP